MRTSATGARRASSPGEARRARGFTLIELMAVALIMSLMLAFFIPGLAATRGAALRNQAMELAASLELARQRAVLTGKPHRLLLDLEQGLYRVEWYTSELVGAGVGETPLEDTALALGELGLPGLAGEEPLDLSPPTDETRAYQPLPDRFGRFESLRSGLFFAGVDTPEGWIDQGDVVLVFIPDGSTDPAEIVIADDDERTIALEVRPLLETVRIHDVEG